MTYMVIEKPINPLMNRAFQITNRAWQYANTDGQTRLATQQFHLFLPRTRQKNSSNMQLSGPENVELCFYSPRHFTMYLLLPSCTTFLSFPFLGLFHSPSLFVWIILPKSRSVTRIHSKKPSSISLKSQPTIYREIRAISPSFFIENELR